MDCEFTEGDRMTDTGNFYDIRDYGAQAGERCTEAIQAAFNDASLHKGTVLVPEGTYISGTLQAGEASLYLARGAVLKASDRIDDYRDNGFVHNEMKRTLSFLYFMHAKGVRITGEGTIVLSGSAFYDFSHRTIPDSFPELTPEQHSECTARYTARPTQPMFFYQCSDVAISGITILDAPCWTLSFNDCQDVRLRDLNIQANPAVPNNDGMHFCGCRRVYIDGCSISTGDDCIAFSGITDWDIPCEDIFISNCSLTSSSKAIVIGYMHSIVRNVLISNCVIKDSNRGLCIMASPGTGLVEHVRAQNLIIDTRTHAGNWWGNGEPICIFALRHDNPSYLRPMPARNWDTAIRDVYISGVGCSAENVAAVIGDGQSVRDITLKDITYTRKPARNVKLKGEGTVDTSPAEGHVSAPNGVWLLIQGAQNVTVENCTAYDEAGYLLPVCRR